MSIFDKQLNRITAVLVIVSFLFFGTRSALASGLGDTQGVVVTTPGSNLAEAKAFANARDRLLLSEWLESRRPGDDHDHNLRIRFEKAQRAWLSGETETARQEFRALTELSLKADWRNAQREVLQAAYLRLAQSSESGTERESWLESAARLFGEISPNAGLFPPPLLSDFDAMKTRLQTSSIEIDLRDVFSDFHLVLIDGRKIDLTVSSRVRLSKGLHRFTALSDSHEAVTEFLTAAQLRVLRLSPPVLTDGVCESAKIKSSSFTPDMRPEIFSGLGCLKTPALTNQFVAPSSVSTSGFQIPSPVDEPVSAKSKTWLWIVGGFVLAGAGYALSRSNSPEPVHRTGF